MPDCVAALACVTAELLQVYKRRECKASLPDTVADAPHQGLYHVPEVTTDVYLWAVQCAYAVRIPCCQLLSWSMMCIQTAQPKQSTALVPGVVVVCWSKSPFQLVPAFDHTLAGRNNPTATGCADQQHT
jgi:hypothetical protein